MRFNLVDHVASQTEDSITTHKLVSQAEEYLQDHFPTFPVLPGVLMIEAMVQAARTLMNGRADAPASPLVLGQVRAMKYGTFVPPGSTLVVTVKLRSEPSPEQPVEFDGSAMVLGPGETGEGQRAAAGRFELREARLD